MIAFISGTVDSYGLDWVVINQNGVGWQIAYAHPETLRLNQEVKIYTYMHMTENDTALFGFASAVEKQLFLKLISVKGLGPKTAMAMLARSSADKIIASIEQGDVASLKRLPGIGAKSASQIVLDLKGKLVEVPSGPKETKPVYSTAITEAMEGLKSLGYKPGEVNAAAAAMEKSEAKTKEEYLKIGLRFLMSTK